MTLGMRIRAGIRLVVRDERGIALITAIGVLGVLTTMGTAAIAYSSTNYRSATVSVSGADAGHGAEAGLAQAVAVIAKASDPGNPSALPAGSASIENGTISWSGSLYGDTWTITATSAVRNPTGAGDVHRTVKTQVRVYVDAGASGNEAWNYVYSDDTSTCMTVPNSVTISTPLFVKGDLCLQNSAQVLNGPLKVGGTITTSNTSSVGSATARIAELHVGGGCRNGNGAFHSPCTDVDHVYGIAPDANPGTISKPPVDLAYWYANATPGPGHNCTVGSFPGGFDNDGVMNRSLPAAVNLTPAAPYDCAFTSGSSTLGRIAWNPSTAQLTVMGTLFFDGNIVMNSNMTAIYSGRSTIYASGRIELGNSYRLCAAANCDRNTWDPNENLIVFVAGSSTDANGFYIHDSAVFQGAVYAVNDYREDNFVDMQGPVIAHQLYYQNNTEAVKWVPIWALVQGAPTASTTKVVQQVSGTWGG